MPFEKRKQEPGPPSRNTGPGPARPASWFFRTGVAGPIPLDVARNGSKMCKAYMASVGPSSVFKDGRSPPISIRKVRSKATPSGLCPSAGGGGGSQVSGKLLHFEDQITERLKPVSSFTIPPTEEDSVSLQRKKKDIECLSSRQGAGQDPGISFSQAVPPALSNAKGPMYPYPPTMPYGLPTYPISSDLYFSIQNNHLDTQNTSSFIEEVRNYHSIRPQRDETASASHGAR